MVFDTIIKNGLTVDFQNMKTVTRTLYIKDGLLAQGAEGDTANAVIDAKGTMFCRALLMSTSTSTHSTAISVPMPISSAYPWASPRQWMPAHAAGPI